MSAKTKQYIGDGVYADYDGYALILTTEDGIQVTNIIVLEPQVFTSLIKFTKSLVDNEDSEGLV